MEVKEGGYKKQPCPPNPSTCNRNVDRKCSTAVRTWCRDNKPSEGSMWCVKKSNESARE